MGSFSEDKDVASYKKKKTSSKSKSSKRADHKHDYEKVILESWLGYEWGGMCKICGRIGGNCFNFSSKDRKDFMKPRSSESVGYTIRDFLTVDEIKEKYPGIKIFKFDKTVRHGWVSYKEVRDDEERLEREDL